MEKRIMTKDEQKYAFAQSHEVSMKTGLVGHLRADMGSDGNSFFSTWVDWREDLKTREFKDEFNGIINSLREKGEFLHNRAELARFCYATPQAEMDSRYISGSYGVRVDTADYAYFLRLSPVKGDYNLYCYCYVRKWLDDFMSRAAKGIRFIDSNYRDLFRLPDGDRIVVHSPADGDKEYTCRYIDDSHVEVGDNIFHICQFAEFMERNGATYEPAKEGAEG